MSNITRKHIEELISKISELERYLEEISAPEQFLQVLDKAKQEILTEKYGLVFEDHTEESKGKKNVNLVEERSLRIENGGQMNQLIEGENMVVLKLLEESYTGKIDVIYIDPPYNTGMDWLNYSDHDYADEKDLYIHSKWLSFMKKRLKIANNLLTNTGIMYIHIDENEIGNLLLLCGHMFGEKNIDVLIWPKTDYRFDQNRVEKSFHNIKMVHEYVLVCFKEKSQTNFNKIMLPTLENNQWIDSFAEMESILKGLGTTSSAKDELGEIFGNRYLFQTPKPMKLIKELVRAASKSNSIILDFFAGSGTTGHAVMDLNKEDKGDRVFILINNNENNICREITYERLKWAIEKEKYSENLKYFTITYGD